MSYTNAVDPQHYKRLTPEPIKVIQGWKLNFCLGAVVKYVARAGFKGDAIEDLEKAKRYLEFEIDQRKEVREAEVKAAREAAEKAKRELEEQAPPSSNDA